MAKKLWIENIAQNPAVVFQDDAPNQNFTDETNNILAWNQYGRLVLDLDRYRTYMSPLFYAIAGNQLQNWANLSAEMKYIGAYYFFVPYALRVPAVITDEEDILNWRNLLVKTQGSPIYDLIGRARVYQEMRMWVGDYLRKDVMNIGQTQAFFKDVDTLVGWFVASNCPDFKYWLNNTAGTPYENDGYEQTTYIPSGIKAQLLIDLMNIYNGNY